MASVADLQLDGLVIHQDGSYTRGTIPTSPANPDFVDGVASKDLTIEEESNLWVRVFCGFIQSSADDIGYHHLCEDFAKSVVALVVSVNYRIAPEHRLPVAYEDGFTALKWLQAVAKKEVTAPWLSDCADFTKVFVVGDSAAGNIVYHVMKRASAKSGSDLKPLVLAGQILIQPFFGGVERTPPELVEFKPGQLTTELCDVFWKYTLPDGANRDHPYCNPMVELPHALNDADMPRTLVVIGTADLLHERQLDFAKKVKEIGIPVQQVVFENAGHAFYMTEGQERVKLVEVLTEFVSQEI
ncbi:hypothetical protein SELMODRAFT_236937 [Selaginella moellendorffii]|uniref:Alpha/beta hydrolase fold-3 domain-containing protein n=1 Tax=Selaginella moellendorffii TaxID=88036 RepID=D8TF67_SELML|nr:hypothetical protein SELMODRAFT_236937 [Selaginella moellendorffii]